MTAPKPEDARRDIEAVLSVHRGVYRHTAGALSEITGHPPALVADELASLLREGKVRQYGHAFAWVHVR
jgi:hypothetical protein